MEELHVRPGDVLAGKFRVERILGTGAMGLVVAAAHLQHRQLVAVKVMKPTVAGDPDAVARFLREGQAAASLRSEHVARVYEVGTLEHGAPFVAMEYLEGVDLGRLARTRGALPWYEAAGYLLQACEPLAEAHRAGMVHRDLTPANLFLTRRLDGTPVVKVLDFGTGSAAMRGTPAYLAPEQAVSVRDGDGRTDIWALGVIGYQLVSGRLPFEITGELVRPLREVAPGVPPGFEDVIGRCLAKEPDGRHRDVAELAEALAPFAPEVERRTAEQVVRIVRGPVPPAAPRAPMPAPVVAPVAPVAPMAPPAIPLPMPVQLAPMAPMRLPAAPPPPARRSTTALVVALVAGVVAVAGIVVALATKGSGDSDEGDDDDDRRPTSRRTFADSSPRARAVPDAGLPALPSVRWPDAAPPPPPVASVEGTIWSGTDSDGDLYRYYFNAGGKLMWDSPGASGNTSGTWIQTGDQIQMETNGHYADWKGTIRGDRMEGEAWNQQGRKWTWQAQREGATAGVTATKVEGTKWAGADSTGDYAVYYFVHGGEMGGFIQGRYVFGGRWEQTADRVTFTLSGSGTTMSYEGIVTGETIRGTATNGGSRSTWKADLQPEGPWRPQAGTAEPIEGTVWSGTDSDGDLYTYYFNVGGQLSWDSPSGTDNTTGTWRQKGNILYMETNGLFAEWEGAITGDQMEGRAWNTAGHTWSWSADRKKAKKPKRRGN